MQAQRAEGWYRDPYQVHDDRWMSAGRPTKLVRDGQAESWDPPPDLPLPDVLVPAVPAGDEAVAGSCFRRADEACDAAPYSDQTALLAVLDYLAQRPT